MATLSRVVHTVFSSVSHRGPVVTAKRFLRVDPEEEIERLFLKRSFEQRCQENCRPSPFLKNIERHSDGVVDETQQQQPPRHLASKLIADHEKEIPPLSSLSESRLLSELRPIPIEAIQQDEYIYENESAQAIEILLHYNIFVDLFKANLMFVPDPTINFTDSIMLMPDIMNGVAPLSYSWIPDNGSLSCADCLEPTISGLAFDTEYTLIVTDANGCTGSDNVFVRVTKTRNVFVANAFTPNDDLINDILFVQGDVQVAKVRTFRVFDRWGELVHEVFNAPINDTTFGWDGTFKSKPMNSGTFSWFAEVEFIDGVVKVYKGSVVLLR